MLIMSLSSKRKMNSMYETLKFNPNLWFKLFLSSVMITSNWGLYIYAVNSGQILQGSLAYYISPLLSVAVGSFFFKEDLKPRIRVALGFCALGVLILIFGQSILLAEMPRIPWLALALAFTFFGYGFIKKSITIPAVASSFIEGLFFVLPSAYFIFWGPTSTISFYTPRDWILFTVGGAVTGIPLVFFSYATQRLPLATVGFFQYLSPTLQLLTAVFIYSEDFNISKIVAFSCIWIGVGFYISHLMVNRKPTNT
jgi:chloramphenicol-sensitive protein RarD